MSLEDETLHLLEGTFNFLSPYTPLWSESSTLGNHLCHMCGLYRAFMRDNLALENLYFTLGVIFGGLVDLSTLVSWIIYVLWPVIAQFVL